MDHVEHVDFGTGTTLALERKLQVTRNAERYPADLQPWGAHASGIAVLTDGSVLVNWYGGTCAGVNPHTGALRGDPVGASRLYLARLNPGESSFEEPELLAGDGRIRYMDANLFVDGEALWAFYVADGGKNDTIVYRKATDAGGRTWGPQRVAHAGILARIMNPPHRHSGRIFAPISAFDKRIGPWRDVIVLCSEDDGERWRYIARIEASDDHVALREPCFVTVGDELHMYARAMVYASFWEKADVEDPRWRAHRSVSRDGGRTWSPAEPVDIPNYDSKCHVVAYSDRELIMAYNPVQERYPLMLAVSHDGGSSWRDVATIESGPGEMSYPTLFVDASGRLHLSYTWNRQEIVYRCYAPN